MVTIVVSSFLPWSVDFHEFEGADIGGGELRKIPSSRKNSGADLRKFLTDSRHGSTADLASRGKLKTTVSLSATEGDYSSPSLFGSVQGDGDGEGSDAPKRSTSLVELFNLLPGPMREDSPKPAHDAWLRPDNLDGTSNVESETIDQPTGARMDSVVTANITSHLGMDDLGAPDRKKTSPVHSPAHSRKPSLTKPNVKFALEMDKEEAEDEGVYKQKPYCPAKFDDSKWSIEPAILVNGGLVNAVRKSTTGKETPNIWIGALGGVETDRISKGRQIEIADEFIDKHDSHIVWIPDENMNGHYERFCKIFLWPILHYYMPDNLKAKGWEQEYAFEHYKTVNQLYADKVIECYKTGDTVWVHDYHLMMVPQMIRDKIPDAKIGFFMHTGFPSPEIWRCVSARYGMLQSVLGANVIGFQTEEYANHFRQACTRSLVTEVTPKGVHWDSRFVDVFHQPIGFVREAIDTIKEEQHHMIRRWVTALEHNYKDKTLIVSRDKLDNVRGVRQKLLAYEMYLERNPDAYKKVVLMQIATSTTELVELQTSVFDIVWRLNEKYTDLEYNPIEFILQDIPLTNYIGMIATADILLITTLREGMGLTAHEFVHCQDGSMTTCKKHGQVILSEFCGTSDLFKGHNLPCNPWDVRRTSEAIEQAVNMSPSEKKRRWKKLRNIVDHHTGSDWWAALQQKLNICHANQTAHTAVNIGRLDVKAVVLSYANAKKRLLILNHEGVLRNETNLDTYQDIINKTLRDLTADERNTVYITSHLSPLALQDLYATIPNLGLIAENGLLTCTPSSGSWIPAQSPTHVATWKKEIKGLLKHYMLRLQGCTLTEHWASYTLDYSDATFPNAATPLVGDLCEHINKVWKTSVYGLEAVPLLPLERRLVSLRSAEFDKRSAIAAVVGETSGRYDFVLAAGSGREDEGVFELVNTELKSKDDDQKITGSGEEQATGKMMKVDRARSKATEKPAGSKRGRGKTARTWTISMSNAVTEAKATLSGGQGQVLRLLGKCIDRIEHDIDRADMKAFGYSKAGLKEQGFDVEGDESDDEHQGLEMRSSREKGKGTAGAVAVGGT